MKQETRERQRIMTGKRRVGANRISWGEEIKLGVKSISWGRKTNNTGCKGNIVGGGNANKTGCKEYIMGEKNK
ncbi:hypothetical protein L798_07399 [Zootermopsis nevadensis]|uniref:Uncharacterized protein n=1 Tax=Zootermopsis nevadensis TaxID=136037 RepID=A0A067R669_ZOONE|nr:hypothetical protein L798_07399 [Zootermopsis nevadensis]